MTEHSAGPDATLKSCIDQAVQKVLACASFPLKGGQATPCAVHCGCSSITAWQRAHPLPHPSPPTLILPLNCMRANAGVLHMRP